VDTDTMLVVATGLCQAANDKQQIAPMVETLGALPETLGKVSELLTDAGYFSEANRDYRDVMLLGGTGRTWPPVSRRVSTP
jgi:hypothetical protein